MTKRRRRRSEMIKLMNITSEQYAALTDNGRHPVRYEIARLKEMEQEAWYMYHAHGGEVTEKETSEQVEIVDGKEVVTGRSEKTKKKHDPNIAMKWFDRIIRLQEKRLELLEFDVKRAGQAHKALTEGDYVGFDPAAAWPMPVDLEELSSG